MRKPLLEIQEIDQYLLGTMPPADRPVFEATLLIAPELKKNLRYQRKTYSLIRWFGRNEKRKQLEALYTRLLEDKSFNHSLHSIFT